MHPGYGRGVRRFVAFSWLPLLVCCGRAGFQVQTDGAGDTQPRDALQDGRADATPSGPRYNRAFVTSQRFDGNLGGRAGADAKCATAAVAGGLPGTFLAFLSITGGDAINRFPGNSRGWMRTDGAPLFDQATDITSRRVRNALTLDELGQVIPANSLVWTGTPRAENGDARCSDWTSTDNQTSAYYGSPLRQRDVFVDLADNCARPHHLYCLEIGQNQPLTLPAPTRKRVFLMNTTIIPSAGLGPADNRCNIEATNAGLGGNWVALLPVGSSAAVARTSDGGAGPYQRVDGVTIGSLLSAPKSFMNMLADGNFVNESQVITGGNVAAPAVGTCSDWSSATGNVRIGNPSVASAEAYATITTTCDTPMRVYCVER